MKKKLSPLNLPVFIPPRQDIVKNTACLVCGIGRENSFPSALFSLQHIIKQLPHQLPPVSCARLQKNRFQVVLNGVSRYMQFVSDGFC